MIKPQHFISLGVASVLSLLLALGLYWNANRWGSGHIEGEPLVAGLAGDLGRVAAVEVVQGANKLVVEKAGEAWVMRDRQGFPAKTEQVRQLLLALAEAQLAEPKTSAKSKLGLLELEDPAAKDAKSRGVRLLDKGGKAIASVVLGKTRWDAFGSGRGGIYARRADETQTWLATGDPKVTADLKDWIETKLYSGDAAKVVRLTASHPGEEALVIEKGPPPAPATPPAPAAKDGKAPPPPPPAKDAKFHIKGLGDKKLKKDASVDAIVEAFNSIDIEDVRKLEQTPAGDKVAVLKLETEGGPTVTFRVRKDKDQSWLSLEATGEGDAKKKADELNQRAKGWEFKIPTWKGEQILKRRADLVETT